MTELVNTPDNDTGNVTLTPVGSKTKLIVAAGVGNFLEIFDFTVYSFFAGIIGHGARPESAIDPIVVASSIVMALQTILSRNVPPLQSAIISTGSIHGGEAFNIIPDSVTIL